MSSLHNRHIFLYLFSSLIFGHRKIITERNLFRFSLIFNIQIGLQAKQAFTYSNDVVLIHLNYRHYDNYTFLCRFSRFPSCDSAPYYLWPYL